MFESVDPTTGEILERVAAHDFETTLQNIDASADAFRQYRRTSFSDRAEWLNAAASLLEADIELVADLIVSEMGKPITQARAEVRKSVTCLRFYAENGATYLAGREISDPGSIGAAQARVVAEPLGPVLAVMPWNFPIWQVIRFAAPTLMAGNTVLLKHAPQVPAAAAYLERLFVRAGLPRDVFQSLLIPVPFIGEILRHPRVAGAALTGSEAAGRAVAGQAGQSIKPVLLELGGSDPFIVLPTADLDRAVEAAVRSRFANSGQACTNAKRFIIHESIYDDFLSRFVRSVQELKVGPPNEEATQIGPLVSERARAEIAGLVDDAMRHGAVLAVGGAARKGSGWFYEPTVLSNIPRTARIFSEEAFGPVASVYKVASLEEGLDLANATRFGLSSSVWTQNPHEVEHAISALDAGAVFINGVTDSYMTLPFGGTKASGFGRELAEEGVTAFTSKKSVWIAQTE